MKKLKFFTILLVFLLATASFGDWVDSKPFLATAVSCNADATYTKTTWTAAEILVVPTSKVTITCTITRTTGTASRVDFEFQCSYDNGATWSTEEFTKVSFATNSDDDGSDLVRYPSVELTPGVSHLRLYRIVNNDSATNLTACNATMSWGVK